MKWEKGTAPVFGGDLSSSLQGAPLEYFPREATDRVTIGSQSIW